MVEFVLVTGVLVPLFVAILQLGLVLHVRNSLHADAAEGARRAAAADRTPADGVALAQSLASSTFGSIDPTTTGGTSDQDGLPTVWVRVRATLPLVGWVAGLDGGIDVTAHAVREGV